MNPGTPSTRWQVSQQLLNRIKQTISLATIKSCKVVSICEEVVCAPNSTGKWTIHTRTATVLWCCPCGGSDPSGECSSISTELADTECCEITTYGKWTDTGQPCSGTEAVYAWVPSGPLEQSKRGAP